MEKQYITCKDVPGGILRDTQIQAVRAINLAPTFDRKTKPWKLVKVLKSDTRNVAWHIRINEEDNFLATQCFIGGEAVIFTPADPKGKVINYRPIQTYMQYLDIETAVDKFYNERYETTIEHVSEHGAGE
jgi:hypothetical protein